MRTEPERAYFLGVGGTATGNLAVALARAGWTVGGSDDRVYPPMSGLLDAAGISVDAPGDVGALGRWAGALFVVGNAVSRGHPQVEELLKRPGERRISLPGFFGKRILAATANLVVAGTHGKSTTAAAAARVLRSIGAPVGWFVGGVLADGGPALSFSGEDRFFVIEGDEYDSAFFDKRAKFVHYRPRVLLLNNLEFDHADIYRDTVDVQRAFRQAIALVPGDGCILYNGDDGRLREILPVAWTRCLSFGEGAGCDFVLSRPAPGRIEIESRVEDVPGATVLASLPGAFNARNLAGAVLGARLLAPGLAAGRTVDLSAFAGLKRRQEILFRDDRRVLVEDFGHHPTALAATIAALRESYPGWSVHAMVEPRSNTLRTNRLRGELVEALAGADRVTLAPVHRAGKLAESERLDPAAVAEVLSGRGVPSRSCGEMEEIPDAFGEGLEAGERVVTLLFSNGDLGGWIPRLRRLVAEG